MENLMRNHSSLDDFIIYSFVKKRLINSQKYHEMKK